MSEYVAVKNAADPEQVAAARRASRRRDESFRAALQAVLATPEGRRVFYDPIDGLLAACGVWAPLPCASAHETVYHAGRLNVGLEWLARLQAVSPEASGQATEEARDREGRAGREAEAARTVRTSDE